MIEGQKEIKLSQANLDEINGQVLAFAEDGNVYAEIVNYAIDSSVRPPVVSKSGVVRILLNDTAIGSMVDGLKNQRKGHVVAVKEIDASLATLEEIRVKYAAL